jgi:alkylation response protein AidB-like acyl-CoA dehydrogenase
MGEEEEGFPYIMQHFALERWLWLLMVMQEQYALEYTIDYMSQREAFRTTIDKFRH